ncbi:zinc finger protein [Saccharopolyspora sp. NPDC003752]|uniref:zinc finger protein n=1 Tax=Saccharopolyspora sp. NPDC050642 TaxID=3157099 RepID=UPI0033BFFE39
MTSIGATYQPHPFHWVPADGQRHASADKHPPGASIYPDGTEITTLCEQSLTAETSDTAWLWGTCPDCNAAVRTRVGLPPMASAR